MKWKQAQSDENSPEIRLVSEVEILASCTGFGRTLPLGPSSPLAVRTHDLTLFMPLRCSEKLLRQQTWEFIPLAFRGLPGVMLFAPALASSPCPLLYFGDSGILPLQPHPLAFGA